MNITVLGSSGKQTSKRECVSILVDTDNMSILLDAGPGVVSSLENAHRLASDIDTIILTHSHGDHILGIAYLIYIRCTEVKAKLYTKECLDLTIYGQKDTITLAKFMLEQSYPGMNIPFSLKFSEITADSSIKLNGNTDISFFEAIHSVPTLSTIIQYDRKKIVYTSDTLPNDDIIHPAKDADLLIHEAMYMTDRIEKSRKSKHSTSLDAGIVANRVNAKQLIIVHIATELFGKEGNMLDEVASVYNGFVSIPFDGSVYHI